MGCCGKNSKSELKKSGPKESKFLPDYRNKPLTEKFYARHDFLDMTDRRNANVPTYIDEITKRETHDWRNERLVPITENQSYGWMERLAPNYFEGLDREVLMHPKVVDKEMHILGEIGREVKMRHRLSLSR